MAEIVADLNALLAEVDRVGPHRDRTSDGAYSDQAHNARSSDHNLDDTPGIRTPHSDADSIPECGYQHATDCFCTRGGWWDGELTRPGHFRHDLKTIEFIEDAVRAEIARRTSQ